MKGAGGQRGFGFGPGENFMEMFDAVGTAGCEHRNGDRVLYSIDQLDVITHAGAVSVDAVQQDFSGPRLFANLHKGYCIYFPALATAFNVARVLYGPGSAQTV